MEEKIVKIKDITELVTADVKKGLKYVHSTSEILKFKKYFEDLALFEMISDSKGAKAYADNKEATTNISSALIASGVSPTGYLDKKGHTDTYASYHSTENLLYAKRKVLDNQFEYLDYKTFGRKTAEVYDGVGSHDDIVDPYDLVKIAVSKKDIESGYVEDHSEHIHSYLMQARDMWIEEKTKYIKYNLTDKPYYKILCEVFENNAQHHYPLVTKDALESIASFTYKLDNDMNVTVSELQNVYRLNDASKLVDMDILSTYSDEIKDVMKRYIERNKKGNKIKIK